MKLDEFLQPDGFLVLDKPQGVSSQQAVATLKRLYRWRKAGHTGTLDPLATGVLPIAYGEATKVIGFLDESRKVYTALGKLGQSSTTYDAEGVCEATKDFRHVTAERLQATLRQFLGEISQVPPPFSAIKIQGKPAYQRARQGETLALQPRTVVFTEIELLRFEPPFFELKATCSRGTYIRSLIHDIGAMLECGAYVTQLRRLVTGPFTIERAVDLGALKANPEAANRARMTIEQSLKEVAKVPLLKEEIKLIACGNVPHRIARELEEKAILGRHLALTQDEAILALMSRDGALGWRLERVLNRILD